MATQPQNFENHARFDPWFHFFLLPVVAVNFGVAFAALVRHPHLQTMWNLVLAFALAIALSKVRLYALKVQDRVIRLEERLRLQTVLGPDLRQRIPQLNEEQLIGIRFASDEELAALVAKVLAERLGGKEIKKSIHSWRGDYWRV